jgi:hypothetical protein
MKYRLIKYRLLNYRAKDILVKIIESYPYFAIGNGPTYHQPINYRLINYKLIHNRFIMPQRMIKS